MGAVAPVTVALAQEVDKSLVKEMTLGADGVTTGASNDIQRATEIARNMVTKWGLSEKMGPLLYDDAQEEVFLGKSAGGTSSNVSGNTRNEIDAEIRRIVDECYAKAEQILEDNRDKLDVMAETLMQYETIDSGQIDAIMEGRKPGPPSDWDNSGQSGSSGQKASDDELKEADGSSGADGSSDADGSVGGPASEH